jgi:propanediol dehydratase small subunit
MTGEPRYPHARYGDARAQSGRRAAELTAEAAASGVLTPDDVRIRGETLLAQAAIAREAGYGHLADNLARAAELTAVPDDQILAMYEALRPGRTSPAAMDQLADRLERGYAAPRCAALVREAAAAYRLRRVGEE